MGGIDLGCVEVDNQEDDRAGELPDQRERKDGRRLEAARQDAGEAAHQLTEDQQGDPAQLVHPHHAQHHRRDLEQGQRWNIETCFTSGDLDLHRSGEDEVGEDVPGQVDRVEGEAVVAEVHHQPVEAEDDCGQGYAGS